MLTRVGWRATAASTCSARIWRSFRPRMARFAYPKPGSAAPSPSATRSAQPRTPLGRVGSSSPTPSVKESPRATNREVKSMRLVCHPLPGATNRRDVPGSALGFAEDPVVRVQAAHHFFTDPGQVQDILLGQRIEEQVTDV